MHQKASSNPDRSFQEPRSFGTLVELLKWRSSIGCGGPAYSYLVDGETQEVSISYEELDRQARAIAASLQSVAGSGEHALLLYPPGLDFIAGFFGCLYAGLVAIPAYPPDPARLNRSLPRLQAIVADSRLTVALTTTSLLSMAAPLFAQADDLKRLKWLTTNDIQKGVEDSLQERPIGADSLAFLQYTSGSTGAPKGVMLTHRNLLHNAGLVYHAFEHRSEDKYLSWLPTFHDMGFMAGVLQPLYGGFQVILMSPISFLQRPARWLKAISRYKATTSGGPNFAYDLCVRKIDQQERARLDLSNWAIAFNGAEPIRPDTLERFARAFEPAGFRREALYPCFGLAEATLIVSGGKRDGAPVIKTLKASALENNEVVEASPQSDDTRSLVGCGTTLPGQNIVCVNPESLTPCLPTQVGEICVSGPSVAKGYWNRPDETKERFRAHISGMGEGPFLRTGDLGFLQDGELFITGRLKDLIIIRGLNHYPQDIEASVERCDKALRAGCGAAFSVEVDGEERLVIVQEVEVAQPLDFQHLIEVIRRAVADHHELQAQAVVLIKPGTIPKTSSGKIQRHACRAGFFESTLEEVARNVLDDPAPAARSDSFIRKALLAVDGNKREDLLEAYLREQVAKTLGVATSRIKTTQPLTAYGLDSLMAIELNHSITSDLGATVSLASLLNACSISDLALELSQQIETPYSSGELLLSTATPPSSAHRPYSYALSYGQQALWFLHHLAPGSAAYNIFFAGEIPSGVESAALGRALQSLLDRHQALRATFSLTDGQPVQTIHPRLTMDFETVDFSAQGEDEFKHALIEAAHEPFDLERGPLFRAKLFRRLDEESVLLLIVHHIVFDGWSLWVLLDELAELYGAEHDRRPADLPAKAIQYTDYLRWQDAMLTGPEGERLWAYWEKELSGELPLLNLPTARPRPAVQTFNGASHFIELDKRLIARLRQMASSQGATLYMVLLAAFQILLYRYTNQQDLLVGSPVSARTRPGLEKLIGCFFNVVVLRADLSGNPAFAEFLARVRKKVLASLDHQEFPSHLLAGRLQAPRDSSRPALFQVTFILQKPYRSQPSSVINGLSFKPYPLEKRVARADLEFELIELGNSVSGFLHYNTDLFDSGAMAHMALHYQKLLESILADPQQPITDLGLLTDRERQELLEQPGRTDKDYLRPGCVHDLLDEQVAKTPDKPASHSEDGSLTYQSLNERANKLASLIRRIQR